MIHVSNSTMRLAAAYKMMQTGETLEYCAGLFSLPVQELRSYIAGLLANSPTGLTLSGLLQPSPVNMPEIKKPECYAHGVSSTKGHMSSSGGIRGHSAGDVFPYVIVLVGSFVSGFKYHVIGPGLKGLGDGYDDYATAVECAKFLKD